VYASTLIGTVNVTVFDAPGSSFSRANPMSCCGQRHAGRVGRVHLHRDIC
jgi:hypothetical protein